MTCNTLVFLMFVLHILSDRSILLQAINKMQSLPPMQNSGIIQPINLIHFQSYIIACQEKIAENDDEYGLVQV
jgi:hypothetical protein